MAWIQVVQEDETAGRLKELYDQYAEPWGGVDNIIKIHLADGLGVELEDTHVDGN